MGNLRRVFYISRSHPALSGPKVKDIVLRAQRSNRQLDVTGILAHSGRHFAQVLEGNTDHLATLLTRIHQDPRHTEVTVLSDEAITRRDYSEWSMGFLYDAALAEEVERALGATPCAGSVDARLAHRIFRHVSDLARP